MIFGATLRLALGPMRFLIDDSSFSGTGEAFVDPSGVADLGVATAEMPESPRSSSSSPNDSFPFVSAFRFFFCGCGVDALYFDH